MSNKIRQFRSRQGRTDKQYEDSMRIVGISFAMFIVFIVVASTYELISYIF